MESFTRVIPAAALEQSAEFHGALDLDFDFLRIGLDVVVAEMAQRPRRQHRELRCLRLIDAALSHPRRPFGGACACARICNLTTPDTWRPLRSPAPACCYWRDPVQIA